MTSYFVIGFVDYDAERTTTRIPVYDLSDVNWTDGLSDMADLTTAIQAITNGALKTRELVTSDIDNAAAPATDPNAQRETKWLLRMRPDVGGERDYSLEVGTADLDLLSAVSGRRNEMSPGTELTNLIAAIDAFIVSPEGNPVTLFEAVHVGRNT